MSVVIPAAQAKERLLKYRSKARVLRQIHSDKAKRCYGFDTITTLLVIVFSTITGFIGFTSVPTIYNLIGLLWNVNHDAVSFISFIYNIIVLVLIIVSILALGFRFRDRYHLHHRSILLLTDFLTDLDDLLVEVDLPEFDCTGVLKNLNQRYKYITEVLPPSSDAEFVRSKQRLTKKDRDKNALPLADRVGQWLTSRVFGKSRSHDIR